MRLSSDEIQFISRKIVKTLVAEGKLEVDDATRVMETLAKVIADELAVEDRLNEEVREVLVQHASEMERSNVTYTEMFKMLKKKTAEAIDGLVRRKIETQKRPIVEGSDEWDVLYRKYYEEEVARHRKVMP